MLLISLLIVSICTSNVLGIGYPDRGNPTNNGYLPPGDTGGGGVDGGDDFMPSGPPIPIIRMMAKLNLDGSYNYEYETGNGINVQESAFFKDIEGAEHPVKTATGFFSYTSPEGKAISVNYVADENGFRPQGDHLPTPPPVPEEIQELIDKIAAGGGCDGSDDGKGGGAPAPPSGGYVY